MKIETTFSDPKVRVSYEELTAIDGAVIRVSFWSGGRYEHDADCNGSWVGPGDDENGIVIQVFKAESEDFVGSINIANPIDFKHGRTVLRKRHKESVYFFILPTASIYEGKDESYVEHKNYEEDKPHDD